jgi:hypothetical protein
MEVFELLLKLNGIVEDFKVELNASHSLSANDQIDVSLSSDYETIDDIYQSVDVGENIEAITNR